MAKSLSVIVFAMLLAACGTFKTNQVSLAGVNPVPGERLYAFQEHAPGTVPVEVFRDTGALGSACYLAFGTKDKMIARIDTGEVARFYMTPGVHELSTYRDPQGRGLCLAAGTPVVERYTIKESGVTRFRLSSRMHRRPELEDYEE
jgi:hypothetical protein